MQLQICFDARACSVTHPRGHFGEYKKKKAMAAKEVLSLLVAGDEAASESETFLASSILQTARPLDTEVGTRWNEAC